jgi:peroxiredoxin
MTMKRRNLLQSLVGASALVAAPALHLLAPNAARALNVGARAPELGLPDMTGQVVRLEGLRGQVFVVDFWASWCAPCADEMRVLERLYTQHRASGFSVIGVSQDGAASNIQQFLRRIPVTFPLVLDTGHAIAQRYAPPRMPTSYIVGRDGIVRHVHAGFRNADAAILEREVAALVAQR